MNFRLSFCFVLIISISLSSCYHRYSKLERRKRKLAHARPKFGGGGGSTGKHSKIRKFIHGRAFLARGKKEKKDYGIYSYILFPQRPDSANHQAYFNIIQSYLNKVEDIEDIDMFYQSNNLNIVYFPIKNPIEDLQSIIGQKEKTEWLIKNYDYARAKFFISKFPKENLNKGPYIVSCRESLSDCKPLRKNYLLQDLSHVHQKVVSLWVSEFLKQSSDLEYWDDTSIDNFSNEIRNAIAIGADGLQVVTASMDWWRTNLTAWIVLK